MKTSTLTVSNIDILRASGTKSSTSPVNSKDEVNTYNIAFTHSLTNKSENINSY